MKLKFMVTALLGLALTLCGWAQNQSDNGGIKQDAKDAAHATGKAAKKTGRKIKHGTKKVVHKGAHATRKGADKVEDKTKPTPTPPQI
jgi:type IV secretory pathway TrbL component